MARKSVSTDPGSTTLTRISSCLTSCISDSANAMRPAFDAQYAAPRANGCAPARLAMQMIQPPPARLSQGIDARLQ
jgi:hypothetical protein